MLTLGEAGSHDGRYTGPLGTMFITFYESIILRVYNLKYKVLKNINYTYVCTTHIYIHTHIYSLEYI